MTKDEPRYYVKIAEKAVPIGGMALRKLAAEGEITPDTSIRVGDGPWEPAVKLRGLFRVASTETRAKTVPSGPEHRVLTTYCRVLAAGSYVSVGVGSIAVIVGVFHAFGGSPSVAVPEMTGGVICLLAGIGGIVGCELIALLIGVATDLRGIRETVHSHSLSPQKYETPKATLPHQTG